VAKCYGRTKNFNRCQREGDWKFFCKEHKWQPVLFCLTLLGIAGSLTSIYAVVAPSTGAPIVWSQTLGGQVVQKATPAGFERELQDAATQNISAAKMYFEVAEHDFRARRYRDAVNNYQKSLDLLPTMAAYLNLGTSLLSLPDIQAAENAFLRGEQIASTRQDKGFQQAFLANLGLVYEIQGKLAQAFASLQAALELAKQIGNLSMQANVLGYLSLAYMMQGKSAEALIPAREAMELAKQAGDQHIQAHALACLGFTYVLQGKLAEAFKAFQDAHVLATRLSDLPTQSSMLFALGLVYRHQGNLGEALTTFRAALKLAEPLGTGAVMIRAAIFTNISATYFEMSMYSDSSSDLHAQEFSAEALTAGQAALDLAKQIGSPFIELDALNVMGLIHYGRKEMTEAFTAFQRVLELAGQMSIVPSQVEALVNLGVSTGNRHS
jgi:tetratricopeptide (TPR) repeat protein